MRSPVKILALAGIAVAGLGLAASDLIEPRFVWNASASAPIGLYCVSSSPLEIGDFVLVSPDPELEKFIERRDYLPLQIPLLKRVAALPGHEICRRGAMVFIDAFYVADALDFDSEGRPLPSWNGCFVLSRDEIFLLNDHSKSLDGRYFGATKLKSVIGEALPIFVRENPQLDVSSVPLKKVVDMTAEENIESQYTARLKDWRHRGRNPSLHAGFTGAMPVEHGANWRRPHVAG